jgi:hypothetical protein
VLSIPKAPIIHKKHYVYWRETGIAFYESEEPLDIANRTLGTVDGMKEVRCSQVVYGIGLIDEHDRKVLPSRNGAILAIQ